MAAHGSDAYAIARDNRIQALRKHQHAEHRFWSAVARMIAERTCRETGLETATRYLQGAPSDRDASEDVTRQMEIG